MAARHVMYAAVLARRIVQSDPTRQVRHWLGARPVRVILMPRHDAPMMRGLAEQLVMPKAHGPAQQLRRGHQKRRIPEQVMKTRRDAPRAQRMKEHRPGISRFVRMEFVEESVAGMIRTDELRELSAQRFDLLVIQHASAGEVAMRVEERDLLFGEAILLPRLSRCGSLEKIGQRTVTV